MAQGKVGLIPANAVDDGQWSQGLISAVGVELRQNLLALIFFDDGEGRLYALTLSPTGDERCRSDGGKRQRSLPLV